jgi:type I restriction enzyme S subunit
LPSEAAKAAKLNPHLRMKDSGIEWLGEIPEHWKVMPIKYVAQVGNGSTPNRDNSAYWDGIHPWLNSSVVNPESVTSANQFVTDLALQACHLPWIKPPAILIGITGEGKTRGMATTLNMEATINQHLAYLKPFHRVATVHYLQRVVDSAYDMLRTLLPSMTPFATLTGTILIAPRLFAWWLVT